MNKVIRFLSKILVSLFMALGIFTFIQKWGESPYPGFAQGGYYALCVTLAAGILVRASIDWVCRRWQFRNPFHFIDTLEHELTHALFGYLTFSPPHSLWASGENEGEVVLTRHNPLNVLAPYFFPLWTFIFILMGLLIRENLKPQWNTLIWFGLGLFIYRMLLEIRPYQTDFSVYGKIFSLIFSLFCFVFILGVIFHFTGSAEIIWVLNFPGDVWRNLHHIMAILGVFKP